MLLQHSDLSTTCYIIRRTARRGLYMWPITSPYTCWTSWWWDSHCAQGAPSRYFIHLYYIRVKTVLRKDKTEKSVFSQKTKTVFRNRRISTILFSRAFSEKRKPILIWHTGGNLKVYRVFVFASFPLVCFGPYNDYDFEHSWTHNTTPSLTTSP